MKTVRQASFGKVVVRLVETDAGYKAVTITSGKVVDTVAGPNADTVWAQGVAEVGKSAPGFWGYEDARARFLSIFPEAFADPRYVSSERSYKGAAAGFIRDHVPIEAARSATAEVCEAANKAFAKTNMATPMEKTRIQALLRSAKGPDYLAAVASLADGNIDVALSTLDALMREHGQPSWPCATYFPFFWHSRSAMFLKPQITKDFAERIGHRFVHDYDARLNAETYLSLLDLADECEQEIASLGPQDRIDVQSFIWVVGAYTEADVAALRDR